MSLLVVHSHFWSQLIDIIASFGLLPVLAPLSSQASASPLSQSLYYYYIYIFNGRFGDCAGGLTDRPKVKSETKNDLFRFTYQSLTRFWSRPKVSKITKTGWLFNGLVNGIFGVFCLLWFIKGLASYPH